VVSAGLGSTRADAQSVASPAVRKKVVITSWLGTDNPSHQQLVVISAARFNESQGFVKVELDASSRTPEIYQKVNIAFAAGAAPDVAFLHHYFAQPYYESGIIAPIEPYFKSWDERDDFYPYIREEARVFPNQPMLYLPTTLTVFILWYRRDWFEKAGIDPPRTFDAFLAAARALTQPPNRYGYALRGGDYYGVQVLEPIWGSAGLKFVDEKGQVDMTSPLAVEVMDKWLGMFTRDKSTQPTAVSDVYPQLFALMERGACGMWIYGTHASPQLTAAHGDNIGVLPTPIINKPCTEITPLGLFMTSSSKEKEAAWEYMKHEASGQAALEQGPGRGFLPVRKSIAANPLVQANKHLKVAADLSDSWWMPPMGWKNFAAYQLNIAPYWQMALRGGMSAADLQSQVARLLRDGS